MKPLIKVIIIITSICVFLFIGILLELVFYNSNLFANGIPVNDTIKEIIGERKYGNRNCSINGDYESYIKKYGILGANDPEHPLIGGNVRVEGRCGICKKRESYGNTSHSTICENCARITNRCSTCGKLIEVND